MGQHVSRDDFEWTYTQEPHASRRKEILAKYPQIKKLMGHDPNLKWQVSSLVVLQVITAFLLQNSSWPLIIFVSYCWGGVINHSLTLAIHDISHNTAFGQRYPLANRLMGMFCNLPLGIPYSVSFKKYHVEHHRYQGHDYVDVDLPTKFEGKFFSNSATKLLWVILQPFFYALRPLFIRPKPFEGLETVNLLVQLTFDLFMYYISGVRGLAYLVIGTFLCMGLHPMAGHFISEHYMFKEGYETYSYYGPMNCIAFNVGYHNEHHDFPYIPSSKLPELRKIAPEYYNNLPHHTSWIKVLYDFITDPKMGPYARIKRQPIPIKPN